MSELNRVALVTGGAKRVGRTIVEHLANDGFDGIFTYLSSHADATSLVEQLRGIGRQWLAVVADLTQPEDAAGNICQSVESSFGRLDLLVNNASLYQSADLADATLTQSRRMFDIHFQSPLLLCQRLAPLLRKSRGTVVNMVDLLAERPWPRYLAYSASKAALANLTLSLARELAPEVTVNGIAPGVVVWPDDLPEAERAAYLKRVPLNRPGTSDDVAELVCFLSTGGRYITGQIIRLDGGRSIVP